MLGVHVSVVWAQRQTNSVKLHMDFFWLSRCLFVLTGQREGRETLLVKSRRLQLCYSDNLGCCFLQTHCQSPLFTNVIILLLFMLHTFSSEDISSKLWVLMNTADFVFFWYYTLDYFGRWSCHLLLVLKTTTTIHVQPPVSTWPNNNCNDIITTQSFLWQLSKLYLLMKARGCGGKLWKNSSMLTLC